MPDHSAALFWSLLPPSGLKPAVLAVAVAAAFGALPPGARAQTLPSGGAAVHGQAVITQPAANQLRVVTQNGAGTGHSAINWQSFSISAGATATIVQPTASSLSINRVVTNTPSAIFGSLSSNGRLVLVNQSGIAVGAGAVIDTAGFTASALRMSDADALAGRLRFGEPGASMGGAAGLTVGGTITAREGDIVLVAPNIDLGTSALLKAPNGSTILAAGQQVEITGRGLEGITMLVQAPADQARNLGRLEGSAVGIFAGTLRHSGEIQATTAMLEGGTVVLKASGDALVEGAGVVVATGTTGGRVDVLGDRVAVADQSRIDVSGAHGGGTIRIGGDYLGRNTELPNARYTHVGVETALLADATEAGDGGRVIVWADDVTRAHGQISANAARGGGGGFVETSGARYLEVGGIRVTASGSPERPGTWLLDPADITITHGVATGPYPSGNKDQFQQNLGPGSQNFFFPVPSASVSTLTDGDLNAFLNSGSNLGVIVQTSNTPEGAGSGDIIFDGSSGGAIVIGRSNNVNTNPNSLLFNANRNIVFASGTTTFQRGGASTGLPLTVQLNPGTTNVSGKVLTSAGATVALEAVADVLNVDVRNGKVWENFGTVTMNGLSVIRLPNEGGYATFANQNTGVVNINAGGTWSFLSDSNPQGGILNNAGTIHVNGVAGGNTTSWEVLYTNLAGGTLHLGAGKLLSMQNAGTLGGALVLDNGSELRLSQQFSGTPNVTNAVFSGTGKLSVASGVSVDFANNSGTLGVLEVGGFVSNSAGTLTVGDFINQSGGNFGGAGNLTVVNSFSNTGGAFGPTGDLTITQASGNLVFTESAAVSALALNAPAGTLSFNGALTVGTTLTLAAGGSITQTGGSLVVGGATVLSAPGGAVDLSLGSNDFLSITGSTGALTVVDINSLVVGAADITSNNGNVTLSATGIGNMTLLGDIIAGSGNVTLNSRSVTQSGGAITGANLTVNSSLGSVTLNGANNVTAARLSGNGASTIAFNNLNADYALSGTGGNLTVTSPGRVTVDQPLNFASGIDITSSGGIRLAADVTPGANLALQASSGLIEQTAGTLFANSGTATINAGGGDIALTSASNQFNVVNLTGGHITLLASNGLIVNTLSSGLGQNVFLDAGAGTLLLPASPINAGTGQITLTSGADLLIGGALTGSDILLSASTGLTIANNITASGFLNMGSTTGGVNQSGSTFIVVAGTTSVGAGGSDITLAQPGNNFSTVEATGRAITLHDGNGLNLGAVNAGLSLDILTNGNVTQSAPVLVSGTTSIDAGSGNVTLTFAGNNLNVLDVSGNAINVVEGAGSSLTVTSLSSGLNQPVSLSAGHTLTLPGTPINTGTADLTLASAIGPLTIPAALNGRNISLGAVTGATVNAPISATGDFTATVSGGGSTLTVNQLVLAGADMTLSLAGNLSVLASAGSAAGLTAVGDQTITAVGNILLQGAVSGSNNRASLATTGPSGTQSITADGIALVGGNGSGNAASIRAAGFQEVTVGNGGILMTGGGGTLSNNFVEIDHIGPAGTHQLITVNGTGSINLQAGSAVGGDSEAAIRSEFGGSQTITFTGGGGGRAISLTGGTVGSDSYAEIWAGVATQVINGAGLITLRGGASGGGLSFGGGDLLGNLAAIGADSNNQTISASGMVLVGGAAGLNNLAGVFAGGEQSISLGAGGLSLSGGGGGPADLKNAAIVWKGGDVPGTSQSIMIGGGSVTLQGGSASRTNVGLDADFGGLSNGAFAAIRSEGSAQLIEFSASGGSIQLTGGTVGSDNHAFITALSGTQTIRGATSAQAPAISVTGGASGGLANEGNRAAILAEAGNQVISAASIMLQGGVAGTENLAQIRQGSVSTGLSSTQVIDIVSSATSALQGGGGITNLARVQSYGTAQTVGLAAGSTLNLSGGTGASFNFARIEALNGNQTITGSGAISVVGGASGGASGQGNFADIRSRGTSNTQTISARSLTIAGGAAGIENDASVRADGNQTVSLETSGANALVIGNAGAAHASSLVGNNQTITAGSGSQSGSITIVGGTAAGKNAGIFANVVTPNSGTQTISTTGSLSLTGGTATGTATCDAASSGACADIANDGSGLQTITANAVQMQGGASGIANGAGIFQRGGNLLLTVGAGGLTMTGGSGGSNNFATIGGGNANGSTLTLDVTGNIVMNALNATTGSGTLIGLGGVGSGNTVTIDIATSGTLTMRGSDVAATGSAIGANNTQTASSTNIAIDAASVSMVGGSAGPARIGSSPLQPGGGNISLLATGAVSLQGAAAGNAAIHTLGRVDVGGNTLDIRNTVSGSEVSLAGTAGVSLSGAASVNASASGTALKVIVNSGAFSNSAGASALLAPNGRWLVYSVDPANDTRGSLAHDFKQYDAVPGDTVLGTGDGLLYSLSAPSVTATLVGVVSKTYDGTVVATLSAGNYSATGIDGDVIVLNNPTTGSYDTKTIGNGKSVVAGSLTIVSVLDASSKPVFGYNPVVAPASGLVGDIGTATITGFTGITALDKVYDTTTAATLVTSGVLFTGIAGGDTVTLTGGTGVFDNKNVGNGKTVTVSGLSLGGPDAGNYILGATSATATGNITPATISAVTGITAANKIYDGTTAATLTTSGAAFTGRLGSDVLTVATAVGNFSDKNVANPKTVDITGVSLGGTDAGNYTLATTTTTTAAAITPATITTVGGITALKVYDGSIVAEPVASGATFAEAVPGDNLTLIPGPSFSLAAHRYSDPNVGTGKVLNVAGYILGGTDAANYTLNTSSMTGIGSITQRPLSTWTGNGGDGQWSNPLNWDAVPYGNNNVAAVLIPAGAGTVTFTGAAPTFLFPAAPTSLQTVSSLRPLAMSSGSLSVGATLAAEDFSQSGGTLGGAGSLIVSSSFSQTGGSIAMGNITIVQNAGNLSFSNISGNAVALVAPGGAISQTGPLVASTLSTSSDTGTTLTHSGNQIANLYAENLGSGAITVANSGPLNVLGLDNAGGNIAVSTNGPMSTFGPVTASGSVTLAANGSGGNLGIFAPVTADGQVVLSAAATLTQDAAVVGANGVTADAGASIMFGPFAAANYNPVVYRIGGIVTASPPTQSLLGSGAGDATEQPVDALVTFVALLQQAADPAPPPRPDDFNADGTRRKPTADTIVTEGEVCK